MPATFGKAGSVLRTASRNPEAASEQALLLPASSAPDGPRSEGLREPKKSRREPSTSWTRRRSGYAKDSTVAACDLFVAHRFGNGSPKLGDPERTFRRSYNQREHTCQIAKLRTGGDQDGADHKPPRVPPLGKPNQGDQGHTACHPGNQQWVCQAQAEPYPQ